MPIGASHRAIMAAAGTPAFGPNLFSEPDDYSTWWTANNVSATTGQTDPFGGTLATTIANAGTGNEVRLDSPSITVETSTTYKVSWYAADNASSWIAIGTIGFTTPGNTWSYFDVGTGALGTQGTGHTAAIAAAASGFYLCSITFTTDATDTAGNVRLQLSNGNNGRTGMTAAAGTFSCYGVRAEMRKVL